MEPDWGDFKVLLALASAGSVAGAARELAVDQSTISRRLAALEGAVGARLIIRGGREFTWTAEGRTLLSAAEAMDVSVSQATLAVRTAKSGIDGTVRISISPGFVPVLMRLLLPTLRAQYPTLNVELRGAYQRVDLAKGEADIAVRMARPAETDLVARRAFDCGWFVYASDAYLREKGRPRSHADLAAHQLVLYVETMHNIAPLRWLEPHRGASSQLSRVDNLEIACQAITADGGIAVLPAFIGDAVPNLRRVFDERIDVNAGWIVYHEALRDAARIRVVTHALAEFFERNAVTFSGVEGAG